MDALVGHTSFVATEKPTGNVNPPETFARPSRPNIGSGDEHEATLGATNQQRIYVPNDGKLIKPLKF